MPQCKIDDPEDVDATLGFATGIDSQAPIAAGPSVLHEAGSALIDHTWRNQVTEARADKENCAVDVLCLED